MAAWRVWILLLVAAEGGSWQETPRLEPDLRILVNGSGSFDMDVGPDALAFVSNLSVSIWSRRKEGDWGEVANFDLPEQGGGNESLAPKLRLSRGYLAVCVGRSIYLYGNHVGANGSFVKDGWGKLKHFQVSYPNESLDILPMDVAFGARVLIVSYSYVGDANSTLVKFFPFATRGSEASQTFLFDDVAGEGCGRSLAVDEELFYSFSDELVAIGCPGNGTTAGSLVLVERPTREGDDWAITRRLQAVDVYGNSEAVVGDKFGEQVALSYGYLAVMCSNCDEGRGSVFIFHKSLEDADKEDNNFTGWSLAKKLTCAACNSLLRTSICLRAAELGLVDWEHSQAYLFVRDSEGPYSFAMEAIYNVPYLNDTSDGVASCRLHGGQHAISSYSPQSQMFPPPLPAGSQLGSSVVGSPVDTIAVVGAPSASVDRFGSGCAFVVFQTRWKEELQLRLVEGGTLLPPSWGLCSVNETEEGFSDVTCAYEIDFGRSLSLIFLEEGVICTRSRHLLAVGAPGATPSSLQRGSGAVFLYEMFSPSSGPQLVQTLIPSYCYRHCEGDGYGWSVALHATTNSSLLVVGAPGASISDQGRVGLVGVWERVGDEFVQTRLLHPPLTAEQFPPASLTCGSTTFLCRHLTIENLLATPGGRFGEAVAVFGNRIFVGSPGAGVGGGIVAGRIGAVYVFDKFAPSLGRAFSFSPRRYFPSSSSSSSSGLTGSWGLRQVLVDSSGGSGARFGFSLYVNEQLLAVGSPGWTNFRAENERRTLDSGAVLTFAESAEGNLYEYQRVLPDVTSNSSSEMFGFAVSLNPLGYAAVSAPGRTAPARWPDDFMEQDGRLRRRTQGSAFLFVPNSSSSSSSPLSLHLVQRREVQDIFACSNARVGHSLSFDGDFLLLGAPGGSEVDSADRFAKGARAGSVSVFKVSQTTSQVGYVWSHSVINSIDHAPASSCLELLERGYNQSGLYWLLPQNEDGFVNHTKEHVGYCDMQTMGGGWLMCFTTTERVDLVNEFAFDLSLPYGTDGYRADCRNYPFSEVLYVQHLEQGVLSSNFQDGGDVITVYRAVSRSPTTVMGGSWTAAGWEEASLRGGVAGDVYGRYLWRMYDFGDKHGGGMWDEEMQLNVCAAGRETAGFFFSGVERTAACQDGWKSCSDWCKDEVSKYSRASQEGGCMYGGSPEALGVSNRNLFLSRQLRSSSSVSSNFSADYGRLYQAPDANFERGAWRPQLEDAEAYLEVELHQLEDSLVAVGLQGGRWGVNGSNEGWVKSFLVRSSTTGVDWMLVGDEETGQGTLFQGNEDADSVRLISFPSPLSARFLRIFPVSWENEAALRVELYRSSCPPSSFSGTCVGRNGHVQRPPSRISVGLRNYQGKCQAGWTGDGVHCSCSARSITDVLAYWRFEGEGGRGGAIAIEINAASPVGLQDEWYRESGVASPRNDLYAQGGGGSLAPVYSGEVPPEEKFAVLCAGTRASAFFPGVNFLSPSPASSLNLINVSSFTIEFSLRVDEPQGWDSCLLDFSGDHPGLRVQLSMSRRIVLSWTTASLDLLSLAGSTELHEGRWWKVTIVGDRTQGTCKIFVFDRDTGSWRADAELAACSSDLFTSQPNIRWRVGACGDVGRSFGFFRGFLDEIRISSSALPIYRWLWQP
ncbi:hypothetical protein GUITHDRAFT_136113 [Guillardia theta CCMP2712]|uniref:F5/8 type C domain-containing protein n=1 Tax=Guillardia theta (strain CCMP2712) TaxID=905079 RepID=L1JMM5_GUITC|nr:hypothetical protein GUITHDRAFT_136113 [Guillardia theta CCMP2712]EKX49450.1 hypothetical protein GUITHDRAFT_136113 [Guillardia theta CCMP2712]|eukprot:XP_005836430.1 hypothetical protein GUITHDRAFT_136113 [Guillardia theta CCMP2712]